LEKAKRPSAEKRVAASCYDELRSRKREESGGVLGESEREGSTIWVQTFYPAK
jgi:hypothetical protein